MQRRLILEELQKLSSHPTASELYHVVQKRLPHISLGTVYRNLQLLAEQGTIQKLKSSGSEARFDGDVSHHYHVRCKHCGKLVDLHVDLPELPACQSEEALGWTIDQYPAEFVGTCPACSTGHTASDLHSNA